MRHTQLNPESAVFQPRGSPLPWAPESWQQWQSRDGQVGCEGNYRPTAGPAPPYFSALAAEFPHSEGISPDDQTASSSDLNRSRRSSLMHRSSSLNDAAEQLKVYSTNTTAVSVPRRKRFSLPGSPRENIWAPTPEEKGVNIRGLSKDGAETGS
ncbi:hypothetical protein N431DRAFT_467672 [Stipitochalara longipes BDJ]|nr:hypothetical protein N431DRAFT_467672 [Stipitochalara longipes BDJ]